MKKLTLSLTLFLAGLGLLSAQDAAAIVQASRDRIKAETVGTTFQVVVTPRRGNPSRMVMLQYSKDGPDGHRIAVAFNSPRTLVDTRFLSMGNAGGADNKVFMNNRIQRLNASGGSGKFAGTDFSYDDIASQKRKVDLDNHAVLREEELNGKSCYVIESSPKGAYQYAKMLQWIDKADSVLYKIEMYDNKNVQVKLYEVLEFRDQDGRYSPWKVKLSDLKTGSNTTMEVQELVYDKMIPDNLFSDRWLETAKYGLD